MNLPQQKDQILSYLWQIEELDFNKLYPNHSAIISWNWYTNQQVEKFCTSILQTLKDLKKNLDLLDYVGNNNVSTISNYLQRFITEYNSRLQNIESSTITNQNHQSLNHLVSLNNVLRSSWIYTDIKEVSRKNYKDIDQALALAQKFLDEKNTFKEALSLFKEALKEKNTFTSSILQEKAQLFKDKAKEHKTYDFEWKEFKWFPPFKKRPSCKWSIIWLISGFLFASITLWLLMYFIIDTKDASDLSIWLSLLRISAFIVPWYFTYFCISQFNKHRKLYEFYMFKAVSLTAMAQLYKEYVKESEQKNILEKATNIIFSEFSEKENNLQINQNDLLKHLVTLVKWKQ